MILLPSKFFQLSYPSGVYGFNEDEEKDRSHEESVVGDPGYIGYGRATRVFPTPYSNIIKNTFATSGMHGIYL